MIRDPLKPLREKPIYALLVSFPITLIFIIISIFYGMKSPNFVDYIDDKIVFCDLSSHHTFDDLS